ncbi:hypothetical protein DIPPA_25631 [Diplonema papillatum]|nr:hypothetical protein DIPPA_25631 [Diplonema papillatum]
MGTRIKTAYTLESKLKHGALAVGAFGGLMGLYTVGTAGARLEKGSTGAMFATGPPISRVLLRDIDRSLSSSGEHRDAIVSHIVRVRSEGDRRNPQVAARLLKAVLGRGGNPSDATLDSSPRVGDVYGEWKVVQVYPDLITGSPIVLKNVATPGQYRVVSARRCSSHFDLHLSCVDTLTSPRLRQLSSDLYLLRLRWSNKFALSNAAKSEYLVLATPKKTWWSTFVGLFDKIRPKDA